MNTVPFNSEMLGIFGMIWGTVFGVLLGCTLRLRIDEDMYNSLAYINQKQEIEDLLVQISEKDTHIDKLECDESASARLIENLKNEVVVLTDKLERLNHKLAATEYDNHVYRSEVMEIQNTIQRTPMHASTRVMSSPPVPIRKRHRSHSYESDSPKRTTPSEKLDKDT
jgi:chromosome segregation ATPase